MSRSYWYWWTVLMLPWCTGWLVFDITNRRWVSAGIQAACVIAWLVVAWFERPSKKKPSRSQVVYSDDGATLYLITEYVRDDE
jgi:hypothetical protein